MDEGHVRTKFGQSFRRLNQKKTPSVRAGSFISVKNIDKIFVDLALGEIVKIFIIVMKLGCEGYAYEAPVPRFELVVDVIWRVGEHIPVLVGVFS